MYGETHDFATEMLDGKRQIDPDISVHSNELVKVNALLISGAQMALGTRDSVKYPARDVT